MTTALYLQSPTLRQATMISCLDHSDSLLLLPCLPLQLPTSNPFS
jgi:hypothetical protein